MRGVYGSWLVGVLSVAGVLGGFPSSALADGSLPSWTGYYVGLSFGERWNRADWTTNGFLIPGFPGLSQVGPDTYGVFGSAPASFGGYAGYNYQFGRWVVGAEGDIGSTFDHDTSIVGIPGTGRGFAVVAGFNPSQTTVDLSWDASMRLRAGYLIAPNVLLYGTGGIAFQHLSETIFCSAVIPAPAGCGLAGSPDVTSSTARNLVGWTVGGGIEAPIAAQWLLRAEYRYADFGTFDHTFALGPDAIGDAVVGTRIATHTMNLGLTYKFGPATAATAADIPILRKAPPPALAAAQSWTGFYAGFGIGARRGEANWLTPTLEFGGLPMADNQAPFDVIALHYAGYAGFNYQIGHVVTGVEGGVGNASHATKDIAGVPGLGGAAGPAPDNTSVGTNEDANVVARLGYLVAPDMLLYGVGGVAFQKATLSSVCAAIGECFLDHDESFSTTRTAPTWGGGVEAKFAHNWVARLDYRYANFGSIDHQFFVTEPIQSPITTTTLRTQTLTFGIAYLFMPGG